MRDLFKSSPEEVMSVKTKKSNSFIWALLHGLRCKGVRDSCYCSYFP